MMKLFKKKSSVKTLEFLDGGLNMPIRSGKASWFHGFMMALHPIVFS